MLFRSLEDFADILEELEEDLGIDEETEAIAKAAKDSQGNPYE